MDISYLLGLSPTMVTLFKKYSYKINTPALKSIIDFARHYFQFTISIYIYSYLDVSIHYLKKQQFLFIIYKIEF